MVKDASMEMNGGSGEDCSLAEVASEVYAKRQTKSRKSSRKSRCSSLSHDKLGLLQRSGKGAGVAAELEAQGVRQRWE